MKLGLSLSPGGLLLPYHLGVLDSLKQNGIFHEGSPIAGSSAGAIAAASVGCGLNSHKVLEATIEMSDQCNELGGARGRLLPLLKQKLDLMIGEDEFQHLQEREGAVAIAYRELFPIPRAILQNEFEDCQELKSAVASSSMFPFFSTNWPATLETSRKFPRVVVDGYFTVPRNRFGCPDFSMAGINVDRTITVSVFPRDAIGLNASAAEDCISPPEEADLGRLFGLATGASSAKELTEVYDSGYEDADHWFQAERKRNADL